MFRRKPVWVDERPFYLVSSAGVPNYGDELITRGWLDWLARRHPDIPVWLDCIEPGRAFHLFRDAHPRLRTTNTLWHLTLSAAEMAFDDGVEYVARMIRDLGTPRFDLGMRDLREVRSVHMLGGGYLNSVWPHQLLMLPALVELHNRFGPPLYATGQGMSPLDPTVVDRVREWVRAFEVFETRDSLSADLLGVRSGLDDAFLCFANSRRIYSDQPTPDTMLLIQGDFGGAHAAEEITDAVVAFLERCAGDRRVGVVEALPPDDNWILPRLHERGVSTDFYSFLRVWGDGFPARAGQTWLSTRFHFHLLASAAGAAGVVLNLDPEYYGVKHGSLRELGSGWTGVNDGADIAGAVPGKPGEFGTEHNRALLGRRRACLAREVYG